MEYNADQRAHRNAIAKARWDEVIELFVEPGDVGDDPSDQRLDLVTQMTVNVRGSDADGAHEIVETADLFPCELGQVATEVTVGGGLAVDRALQI